MRTSLFSAAASFLLIALSGCDSDPDSQLDGRLVSWIAGVEMQQIEDYLSSGGDVNREVTLRNDYRTTKSLLHWAAEYRSEQIIEVLLDRGANPNTKDASGMTPVMTLVSDRNTIAGDTFDYLLKKSDLEIADKAGWTALHYAARYGNLRDVTFLLMNGADPMAMSLQNETPVELASSPEIADTIAKSSSRRE